jgi:N,N-dimethylformamidase
VEAIVESVDAGRGVVFVARANSIAFEGPMNDAMELTAYTDTFSVAAGGRVEIKVSTEAPCYDAALVRLLHGDEHPDGPGFQEREVPSAIDGEHAGRIQIARAGSYVVVENAPALATVSFTLRVWIWPTLPADGRRQTIAALGALGAGGWSLTLDAAGRCELLVGDAVVRLDEPLRARRWVRLTAAHDAGSCRLVLVRSSSEPDLGSPRILAAEGSAPTRPATRAGGRLLLAAREAEDDVVVEHFNGKLETPVLLGRALTLEEAQEEDLPADFEPVAAWDLGARPETTRALDTGPHALHGRVVNRPDRAMTGHAWNGSAMDFRQAPEQYGAIAFHDDDLEDAGWETDIALDVPGDLSTGIYALRLRAPGAAEDHVPFVVRAPRDRATANVALVIPTFSYMAYANDHVLRLREEAWKYTGLPVRYDPLDELPERHREWGCSLYDTHRDGSGVSVSSRLRAIVNLRPRYRWWASAGAQYLASDLYIVHWLAHIGVGVDLITDEDAHREGAALLGRYRTVLTGSHPEYVTEAMLDAVEGYLDGGGRLIYLGGNGFYWVTSVSPDGTHLIEVRRGNAGTRAWESEPGEEHHAFTGERGGLWRHRGRAPNKLVGIGFAAQGWSDPSPGYHRTEAGRDPSVSWIFEGVESDVIGDHGLAMNGAAGDELDRFDAALGSPPHAVVLASSRGHSRYYAVVHEDLLQTTADLTGETNANVRADLTYFETAAGGAVFSTGSKSWCASLSWDGYDNDIARVSENVLRRFLA